MRRNELIPEFVDELPEKPEEGRLYISMRGRCATHLCPCGCGEKVFISFSKSLWRLKYDGKVTVDPSIGNFDLKCRSHYFIRDNKVIWV